VIELPSGDSMWLLLLLLLPIVLPPLLYAAARAKIQETRDLSSFHSGPVFHKPPRPRWYAVQTALLFIAFGMLVFVALPSDYLWRAWYAQAQNAVRPECQAALEAVNSTYSTSSGLVAIFGVFLPWAIFLGSVLYAVYARTRPHP
jgi:hypothetical protein